jgi:dipeptidyl aminopeptidase/acylaminoacyl peptidase
VHLQNGKRQNLGNVLEYSFNKSGDYMAYIVDANNKSGNGIYLYHIPTNNIKIIDTDTAGYKSLSWTENGDGFTALKLIKDAKYKQEHGKVIGVKNIDNPIIHIYDPQIDTLNFPKNSTISPNRSPRWSEDLTKIFFGTHALVSAKKEDDTKVTVKTKNDTIDLSILDKIKTDTSIITLADLQKAIAKLDTNKVAPKEAKQEGTKPDMTIWHWQDSRLQSRQQVLENMDKNYSAWAMVNVSNNKFITLQDSTMKELSLFPKEKYALGMDQQAYELDINLNGQQYRDVSIVNLADGSKKQLFKKFYLPSFSSMPRPSQDGTKLMYGLDGHYYLYDIVTDKHTNITQKLPTSFVNTEDDHNVVKPLVAALGWSSDNKYILLRDLWDIWQVPLNENEAAINLTQNGKKEKIRYQFRFVMDPEEKGIDLTKPGYIRIYGENNKKSGVVRLEGGNMGWIAGPKVLMWEDASINRLSKAKNAEKYLYVKEKFNMAPEFYLTGAQLDNSSQLTKNTPDKDKFLWSEGAQLVDFVSDKGDKLQAALFLPAGYQKGKKYPTIVYYYEKLSQTLHSYSSPSFSGTGWNPNIYTSNGYAVLVPDIVYKMDDPGMSAVWCVLPAVKAAIKTGVIDESRMGLHGHSWGGYQTSFLITQTNMFKAAAAGAPLTNMISMYDLIYWNSGGGNMSIFEASQGRFKGAPWENWDAYQRNSPVYHVKNVNTPLLLLHNDKDGAVDFTQGIEYYNALRRLKKPVIMMQYKGENHGLSKPENRKDYSVRMMEFFDTHLKGENAPDWIKKGIDKLKMEDHLETRTF